MKEGDKVCVVWRNPHGTWSMGTRVAREQAAAQCQDRGVITHALAVYYEVRHANGLMAAYDEAELALYTSERDDRLAALQDRCEPGADVHQILYDLIQELRRCC